MKVAKRFKWEAAHRLPWHQGACSHLHGHSYRMTVELEGEPDANGMLVDFQELKSWLKPVVSAMDHSTLVFEGDEVLLSILRQQNWKATVFPYDTTAENVCRFVLDALFAESKPALQARGIRSVAVRIAETETCYAEMSRTVEN